MASRTAKNSTRAAKRRDLEAERLAGSRRKQHHRVAAARHMFHHRLLLAAESIIAIDALEHIERIGGRRVEQGGERAGGSGLGHDLHYFLPPF